MAKKKTTKKTAKKSKRQVPRVDTDALTEELQARFGGEGVVIQRASELETRYDLRRRSGIPSLDIACGGGLPAGGLSQIDGPEGVGKNFLLNCYFHQAQRIYGNDFCGVMLCLEFPFDKWYARACGFKVPLSSYELDVENRRRQECGEPLLTREEISELTEEIGKFYILRGPEAERLLDSVVEYIRSNSVQIIGVDSWDSMLTSEEDRDLEDAAKVADASNIQTRWMKKVQGALTPIKKCPECYYYPLEFKRFGSGNYKYYCKNDDCKWEGKKPYNHENETTIIGIRQVRSNLNRMGMRQREWKVGGAWALKHGKLIDVQLRPGEIARDKTTRVKISKEINWELIKGKAGTHEGKVGMYKYYFDPPEVDFCSDMVNWCKQSKVIQYSAKKWHIHLPGADESLQFASAEKLQRAVEDNPDLQRTLWQAMLRAANLDHVRYK